MSQTRVAAGWDPAEVEAGFVMRDLGRDRVVKSVVGLVTCWNITFVDGGHPLGVPKGQRVTCWQPSGPEDRQGAAGDP